MQDLYSRPVTLCGQTIRLEPLSYTHAEGLAKHADPDLFRLFAGHIVKEKSLTAVLEYIEKRLALPNTLSMAMVLLETGQPVGHSSFMSIREKDRVLEIGGTWIGRAYQGTRVNPEAKLLMMQHAFETLGCVRVELKTDERNLQSQRAMEKLGLVREGVLRKHIIAADGHLRNTVYYSVIDEEWPAMKQRLQERLAR